MSELSMDQKNKDSQIYKKWWFILISVLLLIAIITGIVLAVVLTLPDNDNDTNTTSHLPTPYNENASYTMQLEQEHREYSWETFLYNNLESMTESGEYDYVLGAFNLFGFTPFALTVIRMISINLNEIESNVDVNNLGELDQSLGDILCIDNGWDGFESNHYVIPWMFLHQTNSDVEFDYQFSLYLEDEDGTIIEKDEIGTTATENISLFFNFSNVSSEFKYEKEKDTTIPGYKYTIEFDIEHLVTEINYSVSKHRLIFDFNATNFQYFDTSSEFIWGSEVYPVGWESSSKDNFSSTILSYDIDDKDLITYGIQATTREYYDASLDSHSEDQVLNQYEYSHKFGYMYGFNSNDLPETFTIQDVLDHWNVKALNDTYIDEDNIEKLDYEAFLPKEEWDWIFELNDSYVHFIK